MKNNRVNYPMIKQYRLLGVGIVGYYVWLTGPDKSIMFNAYSKKTVLAEQSSLSYTKFSS